MPKAQDVPSDRVAIRTTALEPLKDKALEVLPLA